MKRKQEKYVKILKKKFWAFDAKEATKMFGVCLQNVWRVNS